MPNFDPYAPPDSELLHEERDGADLATELETSPQPLSRLFSITWSVVTENLGTLIVANLIIYLPLNIFFTVMNQQALSLTETFRFSTLLYGVLGVLADLVTIQLTVDAIENREVGLRSVSSNALKRWGRGIGASFIANIFIFGATLLLLVPGIIWAVYLAFILQVVIATNHTASGAITYSKALVRGRWWSVFGVSSLYFGGLVVFELFELALMMAFEFGGINSPIIETISGALGDTTSLICTVFFTVYFLNLHLMRQREQQEIMDEPID